MRRQGVGRFVLRALAIAGALAFLALVMLQARAFYGPPRQPATTPERLLAPPTKSAPVVRPPPPEKPIREFRSLFPATKAGVVIPPNLQ